MMYEPQRIVLVDRNLPHFDAKSVLMPLRHASPAFLAATTTFHFTTLVLPWFGSVFFRFFVGFFIIENAVIDMTAQVMVENISPLHIFQIKKDSYKSMQPILRYSKNNKQLF